MAGDLERSDESHTRIGTCLPHLRGRRPSSRPAHGGWSGGEQGAALASARPHIDAPPPDPPAPLLLRRPGEGGGRREDGPAGEARSTSPRLCSELRPAAAVSASMSHARKKTSPISARTEPAQVELVRQILADEANPHMLRIFHLRAAPTSSVLHPNA